MRIEWSDAYKIGDETIDTQHRIWFERINSFLEAPDQQSLVDCEMLMYQYTRTHFKYEERLMQSIGYPATMDHIRQHNALLSQLNDISAQLAAGTLNRATLSGFLRDWLVHHIMVWDTKLAEYTSNARGDTNP